MQTVEAMKVCFQDPQVGKPEILAMAINKMVSVALCNRAS